MFQSCFCGKFRGDLRNIGDTIIECCSFCGNYFYICGVERLYAHRLHILKVFSHCPYVKMWKFSEVKDGRTALIPCIYAIGVPTPIVYHTQVWGIVSFILLRVFHNLHIDKRKTTPHFLFIITAHLELVGKLTYL